MKLYFTLSLIIITALPAIGQPDSIPNSNFEYWNPIPNGESLLFWKTSDSLTFDYGGGHSAFRGTDSYGGSSSLHLKSTQITYMSFTAKVPGIATNGELEVNAITQTYILYGGTPFTSRPSRITGYFKYAPLFIGETGLFNVYLLRNSTPTSADTVARSQFKFTGTVSTYTKFDAFMIYHDYTNLPEVCLISIQSSKAINDPSVTVGTELVIDSLKFTGTVGVDEVENYSELFKLYPSPADKEITIENKSGLSNLLGCNIFDIEGKLILSSKMNSSYVTIDISKLSNGKYLLELSEGSGKVLYVNDFSIAR